MPEDLTVNKGSVFARPPIIGIQPGRAGGTILVHRGVTVGEFTSPPRVRGTNKLPYDDLTRAAKAILGIEGDPAHASAAARVEASSPTPVERPKEHAWPRARRRLIREALDVLGVAEAIELDRRSRNAPKAVIRQLRTITGGSLACDHLDRALAAKTLELAGVSALRDALSTPAARRTR